MTNKYIVMPSRWDDLRHAALDQLSSPELLRRIYHDYKLDSINLVERDHPLIYLAYNPSLPLDIFNELFERFQIIEYNNFRDPEESDLLSNFFFNPLTTFEQVLSIVCNSYIMEGDMESEGVSSSKTVVEIFDKLALVVWGHGMVFVSKLLCSPLVSDEDFKLRTASDYAKLRLPYSIFSSPRFIPSDADYKGALVALASADPDEFDYGLSILTNPSSTSEFLTEAHGYAAGRESVEVRVYKNLNCPIELSASFVLENLDEYRWRPSALLALNLKANDYLTRTQGEGPWADLPLSWKLEMIVG